MFEGTLPSRARVVIVGGGIIGCSVAYHLAELGFREVVLLEQGRLTSGTTWHAAGLIVTFGSTSETSTEMRKYTRALLGKLEEETGQSTGFLPVGFIEVAADSDRLEEYRRVSAFNRYCGVDVHELSPREVLDKFPLARTDDLLAGFYVKEDGRANPVDITMAFAKGARKKGVTILEGVTVTGVRTKHGAVAGVETPFGYIEAEYVVNCAGMWARQLGALSGVNIPLQAAEHYYLITGPMRGMDKTLPVLEDPASYGYFREEMGGLMIGLFEPVCAPWKVEGVAPDFAFGEIEPDWERMGPYLQKAMARVPSSLEAGIKKFFCGPESFTADLRPIVGEAPELKNYFVAAGMNSIGILTSGGMGRVLAHWIAHGYPDCDVTGMNVDRLHPYQATPEYRRTRTVESLGMVYQCHYPMRSMQTARGAKRSPLHHALVAEGAYFKDVSGWEGANWFAGVGQKPDPGPLTFGRPSWFPNWEREHLAARTDAVLFDMSFMSKFLVLGRDAGALLDRISANRVDGPVGRVTYTQWLSPRGLVEADVTVTKEAEGRFLVVATDTAHRHVETWMRRHVGDADDVHVVDVSGALAELSIQGPRARQIMSQITAAELSNEAFPFRAARTLEIGYARVLCVRITYVGELGYELYVPAEQAEHVYELVCRAGQAHGLRHAGLAALGSLRLEKGYRDYGHDIDNTDTVWEAGLGAFVAMRKPAPFVGRAAAQEALARGEPHRRLVSVLVLDPEPLMFHAEVIRRDGVPVGTVRSASYGFSLGGAVGLAMVEAGRAVDSEYLDSGEWTVDIAGRIYPVKVSLRPLYDPDMARVRA